MPSSHHTTGHHFHLNREGVCVFDEDGLYSEALAEHCSLVDSFQGYSLICVEAPGKLRSDLGEGRGGEGRGEEGRGGEGRQTPKKRKVDHIHVTSTRAMSSCLCTHTRILIFHTAPYSTINII